METKIITIRTITPLFVKGKDPDFGEGMLRGHDNTIYLIDKDCLCEYLACKDMIDAYIAYYHRPVGHDVYVSYAELYCIDIRNHLDECAPQNQPQKYRRCDHLINGREINLNRFIECLRREKMSGYFLNPDHGGFEKYKMHSLRFFLDFYGCFPLNDELKSMSKGILILKESNKSDKYFIQTVNEDYYVPGSSIKGAIRNALLWSVMKDNVNKKWLNDFARRNIDLVDPNKPDFRKRNREEIVGEDNETLERESGFIRKKNFVPDFENEYHERWKNTNEVLRDIFRAVKISDSLSLSVDMNYISVVTAVCINQRNGIKALYRKDFAINLHALPPCTDIQFTINLDTVLLKRMCGSDIPNCLCSIDNLLSSVENYFSAVYANEKNFFSETISSTGSQSTPYIYCQETQSFYNNDRSNLFRIGWGGGLMTKTQFLNIENQYVFNEETINLRKKIRDSFTGRKKTNPEFNAPKSRCLIIDGEEKGLPLGWCELIYEKKKLA